MWRNLPKGLAPWIESGDIGDSQFLGAEVKLQLSSWNSSASINGYLDIKASCPRCRTKETKDIMFFVTWGASHSYQETHSAHDRCVLYRNYKNSTLFSLNLFILLWRRWAANYVGSTSRIILDRPELHGGGAYKACIFLHRLLLRLKPLGRGCKPG
jgi:hypothetical protein